MADLDKYRYALNSSNSVAAILTNNGIPANILPYALAQIIFETNGFKSRVSKEDLNLSGIKWINKSYQNATKGRQAPEGDHYAKYASYNAWAQDFLRIISKGPAKPINATSLRDYVDRLHANKYFTSNPDIYYRGVAAITAAIPQLQAAQDQQVQTAKKSYDSQLNPKFNLSDKWRELSTEAKVLVGGGLILISILIIKK